MTLHQNMANMTEPMTRFIVINAIKLYIYQFNPTIW